MLDSLRQDKIDWYPMLRSNKRNLHPVMFGIYDDRIYHHGAGFRSPVIRTDLLPQLSWLQRRVFFRRRKMPDDFLSRALEKLIPYSNVMARIATANQDASKQVMERIRTDREFFREFI